MALMPSPSFANDQQLAQIAAGGLPGAINEQIMRQSMKGYQAPPRPEQQPPPPKKMNSEDMIRDFVSRLRASENQQLVPAGTPMQPPGGQPPQGGPPKRPPDIAAPGQVPKLQNDKAGIMKYAEGGVVRGFEGGGAPWDNPWGGMVFKKTPDPYTNGRGIDGYQSGPTRPSEAPPEAPPPNPVRWPEMKKPPPWGSMTFKGEVPATAQAGASDPYTAFTPKQQEFVDDTPPPMAPVDDPNSFEAQLKAMMGGGGGGGGRISAGQMQMPKLPDFHNVEWRDPDAAGNKSIADNKDKIDARKKPFDDLAAETNTDLEESKRKGFFSAVMEAGIAMMQGGDPNDPRSASLLSNASVGMKAYTKSLDADKEYQDKLKDKIAQYKLGGAQAGFVAEDAMYARGAGNAAAQSNFDVGQATQQNARDMGIAQLGAQVDSANLSSRTQIAVAEMQAQTQRMASALSLAASKGKGDTMLDIAEKLEKAGLDAANGWSSAMPDDMTPEEKTAGREAQKIQGKINFVMSMKTGGNYTKEQYPILVEMEKTLRGALQQLGVSGMPGEQIDADNPKAPPTRAWLGAPQPIGSSDGLIWPGSAFAPKK